MARLAFVVMFMLILPVAVLVYLAFVYELVWAAFLLGIIVGVTIIWVSNVIDWINDWLASRAANQQMQTANQTMINQQVGAMGKITQGFANLMLAEDRSRKAIPGKAEPVEDEMPDWNIPIEGI